LQRDTRRYQFSNSFEVIDLGLRFGDIAGLEREPAAATKASAGVLRRQLRENGATEEESAILVRERVELNAMSSDNLIAMIERKLRNYGLKKVIPDDNTLTKTYRGFHRSAQLRKKLEEMQEQFEKDTTEIEVPARPDRATARRCRVANLGPPLGRRGGRAAGRPHNKSCPISGRR
jgi:hypothetical protein